MVNAPASFSAQLGPKYLHPIFTETTDPPDVVLGGPFGSQLIPILFTREGIPAEILSAALLALVKPY